MWRVCLSSLVCSFVAVAAQSDVNYEDTRKYKDIDLSLDQPVNEVVVVEQDSPHSNSVHIAHNIPTGSDIFVRQNNPFNTSVHISLNVAENCKVGIKQGWGGVSRRVKSSPHIQTRRSYL